MNLKARTVIVKASWALTLQTWSDRGFEPSQPWYTVFPLSHCVIHWVMQVVELRELEHARLFTACNACLKYRNFSLLSHAHTFLVWIFVTSFDIPLIWREFCIPYAWCVVFCIWLLAWDRYVRCSVCVPSWMSAAGVVLRLNFHMLEGTKAPKTTICTILRESCTLAHFSFSLFYWNPARIFFCWADKWLIWDVYGSFVWLRVICSNEIIN